jgi:hypothetical protein
MSMTLPASSLLSVLPSAGATLPGPIAAGAGGATAQPGVGTFGLTLAGVDGLPDPPVGVGVDAAGTASLAVRASGWAVARAVGGATDATAAASAGAEAVTVVGPVSIGEAGSAVAAGSLAGSPSGSGALRSTGVRSACG